MPRGYSLDVTLLPSLTLPMFERRGPKFVKMLGHRRKAELAQVGEWLHFDGASEAEVRLWSGLWWDPAEHAQKVSSELKSVVEALLSAYRGLRLSVSPKDYEVIFAAAFLSRTTDYYANVVRWIRLMSPDGTLNTSLAPHVGSSFQLRQLPEVISSLKRILPLPSDPWDARQRLLALKWVGPKVADAFLLFSGITTELAPADVHYMRLGVKLGLLSPRAKAPSKSACLKWTCPECPRSDSCSTGVSLESLGPLAGWVQTVLYTHDRLFCSRRRCASCPLIQFCDSPMAERKPPSENHDLSGQNPQSGCLPGAHHVWEAQNDHAASRREDGVRQGPHEYVGFLGPKPG